MYLCMIHYSLPDYEVTHWPVSLLMVLIDIIAVDNEAHLSS